MKLRTSDTLRGNLAGACLEILSASQHHRFRVTENLRKARPLNGDGLEHRARAIGNLKRCHERE